MSRSKKSRKPGSLGAEEIIITRNRTESDVEGRIRKRLKNRKGLKSGNRHSMGMKDEQHEAQGRKDPRHGSKKKVPLIVNTKKPTKADRRILAEEELEQIQNDAQLNILIDRLDNGEKLGAGLQSYVDKKLDRLEILMKQLGLDSDIEEDEDDWVEDEVPAVEAKTKKKPTRKNLDDEDLLEQFESFDLKDFQ